MYEFKKHKISRKNTCEQLKVAHREIISHHWGMKSKKIKWFLIDHTFCTGKKTATKKELQKNKRVPEETKTQ